jgi:hypothetical protein
MSPKSRIASSIEEAYALYQSGASLVEVGDKYGLCMEAVRRQFIRHGLVLRTKQEQQALPHVKEANRAGHVGRRPSTATEFKPGLVPHNHSGVSTDLVVELYRAGKTAAAIGAEVGLSKPVVLKRLEAAGVERRSSVEMLRARNADGHRENRPNWKGGITCLQTVLRNSAEYDQWRAAVIERDDYTCQVTGQRGGRLQVHHLGVSFSTLLRRAVKDLGIAEVVPEHYPAILKAVMAGHTPAMGVTLTRHAHKDVHAGLIFIPGDIKRRQRRGTNRNRWAEAKKAGTVTTLGAA